MFSEEKIVILIYTIIYVIIIELAENEDNMLVDIYSYSN